MNKKDFENGCFSGDWTEFEQQHNFTQKQRKDLAILLIELADMKKSYNKIIEKKNRLNNLMKFYNGGIATEH